MYNIKTLNNISDAGLALFDAGLYTIDAEGASPDAVILRSFKMHGTVLPESVKAVARAGAGTNNIPVEEYTEKGVVVFNTPGANANSVKELVIMALFLSSRKIYRGISWAKSLSENGGDVSKLVEKGKSEFTGGEIKGKTLGIIGLGAIGVMVANDAAALGMNVVGYDPYISVEAAWGLSRSVRKAESLEALLAGSDYISLHVPLNDATKGLINTDSLSRVRNGVKILNFARAALVDNQAVLDAIEKGIVDRYVTDFPEPELLNCDSIIPIPHLGASTPEAEDNCAVMAVKQLRDYLETGNIKNSVNFPDCEMRMNGGTRIAVANRNIPNMVGQITSVLARNGMNIANMTNRNRGGYAYNLIDIDGLVPENVIKEIGNIEGIIFTRIIGAE